MKKVEAIIRTEKLEDLKDALVKHDLAKGMTVTQVLGYGNQKGFVEYVRGQRLNTTLLAKIKIEIVTVEERVAKLIDVIQETTQTGEVGDGKIFVLPVESVIRIRTGEKDGDAI
ncbi:P-II family nitrogen regulator [Lactococcus paracarnosus]|uniref:P-II family nitrogen regulator n=1 Tax=Pseudolactococcus paracarnosus TaxID=2749962 RepID=A0A7L4WES7_9LACT|nr:P-II family nitrogen regulator [Lactococcus paracarnosus]SPC37345.1 regulatory protein P-II for glutamine synthetase [Lactococcus piscium]MCJ1976719.1 P-II family nitrogen regulator [Lactococcus paracarnosus]MCJ1982895.1 P-II family nitrogen regulator [Lactococcus paracarnosus]MCJ1993367.1 P-II family nitrogen regulator [Lactococcus paracarnosus]MCJ1998667.1 P-II family nitrogen regulator [Lactococcus paracarnosus]